jgi:hypothetical protein
MMLGKLGTIMLLVAMASLLAGAVSADELDVSILDVKVNGDSLQPYDVNRLTLERGEEIEVKVIFSSNVTTDYAQVEAEIRGYEHDDGSLSDITHTFDIEQDVMYSKKLELEIPENVEEDSYKLWIKITDRYSQAFAGYNLKIEPPRHSMEIMDVIFSPSHAVDAGMAFLASARVKNTGDRDEDSVKVTMEIPSLGLSASTYIDEIEAGDAETSEELYFIIPECTEAGVYDLDVMVEYDYMDEYDIALETIEVAGGDSCAVDAEDDEEQEDEGDDVPDEGNNTATAQDVNATNANVTGADGSAEEDRRQMLRAILEVSLVTLVIALLVVGLWVGIMKFYQQKELY